MIESSLFVEITGGKKIEISQLPSDQQPVFTIVPERLVLEPKGSGSFEILGLAHRQGEAKEQLICMAASGSNSKTSQKVLLEISIS